MHTSIKVLKRSIEARLFRIDAKWEETLNDMVNLEQIITCLSLCNTITECAYFRYIQILHNRFMTQTLLKKMGKLVSDSCLYREQIVTQVHTLH